MVSPATATSNSLRRRPACLDGAFFTGLGQSCLARHLVHHPRKADGGRIVKHRHSGVRSTRCRKPDAGAAHGAVAALCYKSRAFCRRAHGRLSLGESRCFRGAKADCAPAPPPCSAAVPREKPMRYSAACLLAMLTLSGLAHAETGELQPVRIADPVNGHIHPAACVTKRGTIVVTYGRINHHDLRIRGRPTADKPGRRRRPSAPRSTKPIILAR